MVPDVIQEEIGKLKEGRYIVIDGSACIIKRMQKSAPGKHGHAKYRVDAEDLLTGAKKVIIVHHIDKNRKNNKLSNLAWLCRNCHFLVHHHEEENLKFLEK